MFHRASKPISFSPSLPSESLVFVFHGKKMTQIAEYNKDCKHVLQVLGLHMEPHVYLVPLLLIFVYSNCLHYEKKETPKRQVVKLIDFILRTNICEKRFERKKKTDGIKVVLRNSPLIHPLRMSDESFSIEH